MSNPQVIYITVRQISKTFSVVFFFKWYRQCLIIHVDVFKLMAVFHLNTFYILQRGVSLGCEPICRDPSPERK